MQDISPQDVNQAADPSDAAPVTANEGAAPAGVTAASVSDGGAQSEQTNELEFKPIPYARFSQVNQKFQTAQQELARERAQRAEYERKVAEYEAKLAKANEEPPAWMKSLLPQPKEPTFDDPLEERAYKLEKALEERDRKIAEIEKGLAEQRDGFTSYQKQLAEERQQAEYVAQLTNDVSRVLSAEPALKRYEANIYGLIAEKQGMITVDEAVHLLKLQLGPAARPAVTAPTAPPMASAAVSAPRKSGPGPVTSTPGNLEPARPRPRDLDEATSQLMADIRAGKLRAI